MYIKDGKLNDGYLLEKADGSLAFNAPEEDWLAEGWVKYEEPKQEKFAEPTKNIIDVRREIVDECNAFYNNIVLQVNFKGSLIWIPLEKRISYLYVLKQLKDIEKTVTYRDEELTTDSAIFYLEQMNKYAFTCNTIHDNHLRKLVGFKKIEELEQYDYTTDYPDILKFE